MPRKSHPKPSARERLPFRSPVPAWMITGLQPNIQVQIPLYAPMPQPMAPRAEVSDEDEDDWITL